MLQSSPKESRIELTNIKGTDTLIIPYDEMNGLRICLGIFYLGMLVYWYFFFFKLTKEGLSTMAIIFGTFCVYLLIRNALKSIPEKLSLNYPDLTYTLGFPPIVNFKFLREHNGGIGNLFYIRTKKVFTREQLKTLSLRKTDSGNRLTVDVGEKRLDIGLAATEIEREWLYDYLKERYSL